MTLTAIRNWQGVRNEVRRRIVQRVWRSGDFIPHETELAKEFGCARATVNRALRELAGEGILDRRRKAGTRVAINAVRKARLDIPVIRNEIEAKGLTYRHMVLRREFGEPPPDARARMRTRQGEMLLHVQTLYLADGMPYVFETRWINPGAVPSVMDEMFTQISPNEWLVREVPFEAGDFTFSAMTSTPTEAAALSCQEGEGLFVLDRATWTSQLVITSARLIFHPGYRMHTEI